MFPFLLGLTVSNDTGSTSSLLSDWPSLIYSLKVKSVSRSVMSDSCDPMACTLPGSSVHGILQARILEWVAISFSRDLPNQEIEPTSPALESDSLPAEL